MKKVFLLKGLDCPHCAAQIEKAVEKLPGIRFSSVNLVKQTLTVEAEKAGALLPLVERIVHSHEPEVAVTELTGERDRQEETGEREIRSKAIRLMIGGVLFAGGVALSALTRLPQELYLAVLILSYGVLGFDVVVKAGRNLVKGRVFDENFLMSLSSLGAFFIGEHHEAVAVMLFYQIGEFFQARAVRRSRRSIAELMDLRPEYATVRRRGSFVTADPETVAVGDVILVKPGQKIPLDGVVLEGESLLDTRALTGEAMPRTVRPGDTALSGCVNGSSALTIRVSKAYQESTVARILDLVEEAADRKAPTENFITKFARYYTPAVVILAAILAVVPPLVWRGGWADWIHRGFVFLVVSCPCALVISIPLAYFGGIGAAARQGVLVKGGNYLEALYNLDTVAFDKTGTLTKSIFRVTEILPAEGFTKEQVLRLGAQAESLSEHPIARSVLSAYGKPIDTESLKDYREISGRGVRVRARGKKILAGSGWLMDSEQVAYTPCQKPGIKVYVAEDGRFAGCIRIADEVKADSQRTVAELRAMGISRTVLLTGDEEAAAASVAEELGMDEYYGRLLPEDKVTILERLAQGVARGKKLAFVGDGINDAPVLAQADVGIAMGALGSHAAIEAADVVLMTDEPIRLLDAIRVARKTRRIAVQNIIIALGIKGVFLLLGAFGLAGMWEAVFADVGVALIAVFNAMRILKK